METVHSNTHVFNSHSGGRALDAYALMHSTLFCRLYFFGTGLQPWWKYGTDVLYEGMHASDDEAKVAYGFKEMYCEGAAGSIQSKYVDGRWIPTFQKHKPGTEHSLACPRLTVLMELADILERDQVRCNVASCADFTLHRFTSLLEQFRTSATG